MKTLLFAALLAIVSASTAQAVPSAKEFSEMCSKVKEADSTAGLCVGFTMGVLAGIVLEKDLRQRGTYISDSLCVPPEGIDQKAVLAAVERYSQTHTPKADTSYPLFAYYALISAYRCPRMNPVEPPPDR